MSAVDLSALWDVFLILSETALGTTLVQDTLNGIGHEVTTKIKDLVGTHLSVEWLVEDFPYTNADTWKVEEDCWFSILQGNLGCASSFSTSYETNDEVKNGRDNVDSTLTSSYDQPIETWANIIAPLEPKTGSSREWVPVAHVVLFVVNAVLAAWAFIIGTERGRKMATFVRRLAKNDAKVEDTITSAEDAELEMFASSSESTLYDGCENKRREGVVPPQQGSTPAQGRAGPSGVIEPERGHMNIQYRVIVTHKFEYRIPINVGQASN